MNSITLIQDIIGEYNAIPKPSSRQRRKFLNKVSRMLKHYSGSLKDCEKDIPTIIDLHGYRPRDLELEIKLKLESDQTRKMILLLSEASDELVDKTIISETGKITISALIQKLEQDI